MANLQIVSRHRFGGVLALAVFASVASAQTTSLVNIDTGLVLPKGAWEAGIDGRIFGDKEDNGYVGLRGAYGLGNGFGVTLKGAFGGRKTFNGNGFRVRYGGTDVEGQVRYAFSEVPGLSIAAGVAFPSTPSQDEAFFTAGISYRLPVEEVGIYLGARGLYNDDASLTALTFGADYAFNPEWALVGDVSMVVDGENSFSSRNARRQKTATFGFGIRYSPAGSPNMSYTVGLTNAVGATTGFGTAASFSGATGLFVGLNFKG